MQWTVEVDSEARSTLRDGAAITSRLGQPGEATLSWHAQSGGWILGEALLGVTLLGPSTADIDHKSQVVIKNGATPIFRGRARTISRSRDGLSRGELWIRASLVDLTDLLQGMWITEAIVYENQSDRDIVLDLMDRFDLLATLPVEADKIIENKTGITIVFQNIHLKDALDSIASIALATWTIHPDHGLEYNGIEPPAEGVIVQGHRLAAFDLSDAADGVITQKWSTLNVESRHDRPANWVKVIGAKDADGISISAIAEDTDSQQEPPDGFGLRELVVSAPEAVTEELAQARADLEIIQGSQPQISGSATLIADGLAINRILHITSAEYGLATATVLIRSHSMRQLSTTHTEHRIEFGQERPGEAQLLRTFERAGKTGIQEYGLEAGGLLFDGSTQAVTLGNPDTLSSIQPLSLALWIKPTALADKALVWKSRVFSASEWVGYRFRLRSDGSLEFSLGFGAVPLQPTVRRTAAGVIEAGRLMHVAVTTPRAATFSNPGTQIQIYINGLEAATYQTTTDGVGGSLNDATGELFLGQSNTGTERYGGLMAQFGIWAAILSPAEIAALAVKPIAEKLAGTQPVTQKAILKLGDFAAGETGTSLADSSALAHHGTPIGSPLGARVLWG